MIDIPISLTGYVDICVIVFDVDRIIQLTCTDGRVEPKRLITVLDRSIKLVTIEMWSTNVKKITEEIVGRCITAKNLKVCQFRRKVYPKMVDSSDLDLNPSSVEAHDLYEWLKTDGTLSNIDELDLLPDD